MANALATAASPYLRQHAGNPVDWVSWSPAAFAEAAGRNVPVVVSIGYSTCHWCHVMAHESFEDPATATLMNEHFVCIKVDREEHPEVDEIYMDAVQALSGHGGWPLNAFCDHRGRPFYACTYLPRPVWQRLLTHLSELWREDRGRLDDTAGQITAYLVRDTTVPGLIDDQVWERLGEALVTTFDARDPGWAWNQERAPKFPPSQLLNLLPATGRPEWRQSAEQVLEAMQDAGLHDRVGGGFHRYSVDRAWRLPHFEKMLYDNAQLIVAYARWGRAWARPDFLRTAVNAGDYLLRDLRVAGPDGGFLGYAAAEDADDPGGEGAFYAWTPAQLAEALGEEAGHRLAREWNIRAGHAEIGPGGHPEPVLSHIPHPRGANLAALAPDGDVQRLRAAWEAHLPRLRAVRATRPRPGRDDKVLTDQNALALEAFAALGRYAEERFAASASELAAALLTRHRPDGLERMPGRPAHLTDYGCLALGLMAAFDLLGDPALVDAAGRVADEACARLRAPDGGFYSTPAGRSDLIRRSRDHHDNAWPGGQSALARAFVRLANLTGSARWHALAQGVFAAAADTVRRAPTAAATVLTAWLQAKRGERVAVVAGAAEDPRTRALLAACRAATDPFLAIVPLHACRERDWACLEGRRELTEPQALICSGTACLAPARTPAEVAERLAQLDGA
jgi:uncharacterized protein YyaL (SSP411 family)